MSKKVIRLGFIGCGNIANGKHFPGVSAIEGVEMVAFCDLIVERAEKAAKEYGTPDAKVYTDYHELLKDPTIDAVHVLTPNVYHSEISCAAMEAGKHVICEKPMASTVEDARKMLETRDRTGKMLTIGYQYRHFKVNQIAKKVVTDGWLGDVYYAEATYLRRRGVPTWGVFTDKAKQGGGPLIDIGTHALDLTMFMMNNYDVDYVVGTSFEKLGRILDAEHQGQINDRGEWVSWNNETYDVEDSAVGFVKMKNGATIILRAAWAINMAEDQGAYDKAACLLAGTKGGLDTATDCVRLNHVVAGQPAMTTVGKPIAQYIPGYTSGPAPKSLEAEIWINALRGEGELFVTAEQAFTVTRVLDAIYKSSKSGKPVYFD